LAQNTTALRQAFETQLLTVPTITTANLQKENQPENFAAIQNLNTKVIVRMTLRPAFTTLMTVGIGSVVKTSGLMVIDVMGALNQGYALVTGIVDQILAAFPTGTRLTLSTGDTAIINVASPTGGGSQAAWESNKIYAGTLTISYFLYTNP
jgi:hypothetical protein